MKKKSGLAKIKSLFGYLLAIFFIVIFALYCSGRVGWFLLLVAVAAPLFSTIFSKIAAKNISIKTDAGQILMVKHNHCTLSVSVTNKSWLPTPDIVIEFEDNDHFVSEDNRVAVAVSPRKNVTFDVDYEALYAGGSYIGIKKAFVKNYLGDGYSEISETRIIPKVWKVGIIPEQSTISNDNAVLNNIFMASMSDNSNDETIDETSLMFGGFPGYEYREYRPGDPLKRINSKLSAKKGTLMVRLDEKTAAASVAVVLDSTLKCDYSALLVQSTLETMLGIVKTFLQKEYAVEVYFYGDQGWTNIVILQENDLILLSKQLAGFVFHNTNDRFPENMFSKNSGAVVYCTPFLDHELEALLSKIRAEYCENLGVYEVNSGEGGSL